MGERRAQIVERRGVVWEQQKQPKEENQHEKNTGSSRVRRKPQESLRKAP
jgi:hypothetical protein